MWDSTFQPIVSTTSLGIVTPGTYEAGSGITRVSATEEIRANRTASVLVSACGRDSASPGRRGSRQCASRRAGSASAPARSCAAGPPCRGRNGRRGSRRRRRPARTRRRRTPRRDQAGVVAASLDRGAHPGRPRFWYPHPPILPCPALVAHIVAHEPRHGRARSVVTTANPPSSPLRPIITLYAHYWKNGRRTGRPGR